MNKNIQITIRHLLCGVAALVMGQIVFSPIPTASDNPIKRSKKRFARLAALRKEIDQEFDKQENFFWLAKRNIQKPSNSNNAQTYYYEINKKESLLMASYKIYGNYGNWKDLWKWNKDLFADRRGVREGRKIKFYWYPKWGPYVVKEGDTLSGIAKKVLGDAKRWPEIYEGNKSVLDTPDQIYPGIRLYFRTKNS